jgi:hypothetical protein
VAVTEEAPEEYCRQIEAYLCRKNEGHLIRIVGPAFEQVCGWATRGVPLKVALHGIDRYFERYYAKGPRRRPVRVEFCEADVLDVFDEWRRAVGIPAADAESASEKHGTLPAHLDRVIARLTTLRAADLKGGLYAQGAERTLDPVLDDIVRELDAARAGAKTLRGEARQQFVARLAALDRRLLDAARALADEPTLHALSEEADAELAPFRDRMPRDAYERSRAACVDRLIRDRMRLPIVTFE